MRRNEWACAGLEFHPPCHQKGPGTFSRSFAQKRRWSTERGIQYSSRPTTSGRVKGRLRDRNRESGVVPPSPRLRPCRSSMTSPGGGGPARAFSCLPPTPSTPAAKFRLDRSNRYRSTSSRRRAGKIFASSSLRYCWIWPFSA